jgi:replicative DNA helicase
MSQIVVRNQPCLNVNCGSSDARQVYEEGTSFCFSCKTWFPPDGYKKEFIVTEEMENKVHLEDIKSFPIKGNKQRKIVREVMEFFGVRCGHNNEGVVDSVYYPYGTNEISGYKQRKLPKDFSFIGKQKGLFGQLKFNGGKRIVITEGEEDALAVAQAYYDRYKAVYPVVSVPSASGTKALLDQREWVRNFDEVVLMFDNDKAGNEGLEQAAKIIGYDKVKIAKLIEKDASDVLVKHESKLILQSIYDATSFKPAGILSTQDLWEALINYNKKESTPYPKCLEGLNTKLKGIRTGEITLFTSGTGCFAKDTTILMYDGSLKNVQDVKVGDVVMGDDNTPRNVLQLFRGEEQMARVTLRDNTSFVCNKSHVMSLINNDKEGRYGLTNNQVVDVKLSDYLLWSNKRKHISKAFKSSRLEFYNSHKLPIDPYILGVWLGDGTSAAANFTCHDKDVAIINKLISLGLKLVKSKVKWRWNSPGGFRQQLIENNLLYNKHIPESYLTSSVFNRLKLLAGLLDTDGHYNTSKNVYEFSQKSELVVNSVKRLADSLGLTTSFGKQKNNKFGNCFRLYISGKGIEDIPCVLLRKQARTRLQKKNPNRYKFNVQLLDKDYFYGFEVDGNNRFVLGNFIVTHNSGKSTMIREIILHLIKSTESKVGVISLEESPAETARKLSGMALNKNPAKDEISVDELKVGFDEVFGSDRILVLDHQGSIQDNSIVSQLEYMCLSGCKYIFIDHITILVSEGADGLTGNEAVDKIMNDLLRLVKSHDVWIGLISHLRKSPTGTSFEQGKLPSLDDVKGSGSIKQISFDIVGFARDLTAESEDTRNTISMRVLKSRYTGLTGDVVGAKYDHNTGRLYSLIPDLSFNSNSEKFEYDY